MTDLREEFWDRIKGVNAGMLGVAESPLRLVPMSHYPDPQTGSLWFITAAGTDLATAVSDGPVDGLHIVSDTGIYTQVNGTLSLSEDRAKLDEMWNAVASSWFEDGKQDPDIRLLQLALSQAEVWVTSKSGAAFLFQIAKAKVTGAQPDMGDHGEVTF